MTTEKSIKMEEGTSEPTPKKLTPDILARNFVNAVEAEIKGRNIPQLDAETMRTVLLQWVSNDDARDIRKKVNMLLFLRGATDEEIKTLMVAKYGADENGEPLTKAEPSAEAGPPVIDPITIAETYTKIAERQGLMFKFRTLVDEVPEEIKNSEIMDPLKTKAPTFAKFCMQLNA